MNPDVFFENFEMLAEAPNGVQKLRELILQLAVMGKLVPQDPNDEPILKSVEKMKAAKERLAKERVGKKSKKLSPIELEDFPIEIPDSWHRCLLGECVELINGRAYKQSELLAEGTPVIRIQNLNGGNSWYYSNLELQPEKYCEEGDLLFAWSATFGPYIWHGSKAIYHYHIWKVELSSVVDKNFIFYLLEHLTEKIKSQSHGLAMLHMTKANMEHIATSIPPLAEQKRIVSKVDELMALCDQLEARQQKKKELRNKLNSAALGKMLSAESQDEFEENWRHICKNFDILYDNPENVEELRKAVLQLAVQGKLVEQDERDETASVLIEKIEAEKKKLVKEGKIKKIKKSKQIEENKFPFKLPDSWIWVRLGDVLLKLTDGTHHSPTNGSDGDFKYITAKNVKSEGIDLTNITYVSAEVHEEIYARCNPEYGDILYIKDGATTGIVTINNLRDPFSMLSSVALMKLPEVIKDQYLLHILRSPYFYSLMRDDMSGVAITRVTLTKLNNALVPIAPIKEQKRIIQKVDQLMALCDALKSKLKQEQEDSEKLMESITHHLLMKETAQK